jgi:hypothetical protein
MTRYIVLSAFTSSPIFLLATTKASSILSVVNMHKDCEEDNEEAGVEVEEANGVSSTIL